MARRLQLHEELCTILGSRNVYFQPPESLKIKYPAIIYRTYNRNDIIADDHRYRNMVAYELLHITRDPDSETPEDLMNHFTYISHRSTYTSSDNLHHDAFTLYY